MRMLFWPMLMSSFIGGRSGNRGVCAQPCRLPYELLDSSGTSLLPKHEAYLLSPKDLNYSEHMNELVAAGVTSFKVEGRMKKVSLCAPSHWDLSSYFRYSSYGCC